MITCISSLSVELVGIHVFSYLPLAAMVRLDSAVVQKRQLKRPSLSAQYKLFTRYEMTCRGRKGSSSGV
jgi:hypothetical protein